MSRSEHTDKLLNTSKNMILFILSGIIYSISVRVFTAPNQIAPGGLTGVSTMLNYIFGSPIGAMTMLLNLPVFIWGIFEIGYKLVSRTIFATLCSSIAIDLVGFVIPPYYGNPLLAAIYGGVLEGISLSLVLGRGGTTGGTDMIAKLLARHFRHLSIGNLMMAIDGVVILVSAIVYQSLESALYAAIAVFVSTRVIDALLYGSDGRAGKLIFIISKRSDEIAKKVLHELNRGVTEIHSRGAYSEQEQMTLLCAVSRTEVYKVTDIVRELDKNAFMIIGDVGQINGEGFYIPKKEDKTLPELLNSHRKRREKQKSEQELSDNPKNEQ